MDLVLESGSAQDRGRGLEQPLGRNEGAEVLEGSALEFALDVRGERLTRLRHGDLEFQELHFAASLGLRIATAHKRMARTMDFSPAGEKAAPV